MRTAVVFAILLAAVQAQAQGFASDTGLPAPPSFAGRDRVVDLYTHPPASMALTSRDGALLSFSGLGGHAPGDSSRTQLYVKTTSLTDATIEETAADFEMNAVTGYAYKWEPLTAYPARTFVHGGDGSVFRNAAACRSDQTAPSGKVHDFRDGTCRWGYAGIGGGDGKSAILATTNIMPGGGQGWGAAIIMGVQSGAWPRPGGFGVGLEIDAGNSTHDCPPIAADPGCNIYGIFLNGNGLFKSTIGLFLGGTQGFHYGIYLPKGAASEISFNDSTDADTGIYEAGRKNMSSYRDESTSPTAIWLSGRYAMHQVLGVGWDVDPVGNASFSGLRLKETSVARLPTCYAGTRGRMQAVNDAIPGAHGASLSGGGNRFVVAVCNGVMWQGL